ncbi:metallophosphoesterase family protein [uncultured Hoeflea sp.]|uniref:metallophosphoesterase family protein n=1 Tax=uncultured Hoeflea sp. TaxID=538666 RepID=UPI00260F6B94|nr:metallophosphoesterase family protein [uncultured Hoeflea sp.]
MSVSEMPLIAVVADAHFHDLEGDFGIGTDEPGLAFRRLADTVKSTRVFNESSAALTYTLDDIAARGIRHVILLGDYSDDGQVANLDGLSRLLLRYEQGFGMRFFAVAGNHDIFGMQGRHRSKRFVDETGGYVLATSDPGQSDPDARRVTVSPAMYCHGYLKGLEPLRRMGFFRRGDEIHWETPFGDCDHPGSRCYAAKSADGAITYEMMDASYLVEPVPGLWMLMIDANVFVPVASGLEAGAAEALADSTDAGWNAMLVQKSFVLDWMKDVSRRANQLGKRLLAFSHYPVLDPLRGTRNEEQALLGETSLTKRVPEQEVAEAFIETGVQLHFSGHLHINDTACFQGEEGFVVNVSVPSLIAYPAAYKIIAMGGESVEIETIRIDDCGLDPMIQKSYRTEIEMTGLPAERLMRAQTYGRFLHEHIGHLVSRRHLRREWPAGLAELVKSLTLADVAALALMPSVDGAPDMEAVSALGALKSSPATLRAASDKLHPDLQLGDLDAVPLLTFVEDWYRMKMAGRLAMADIPGHRLKAYDAVSSLFDGIECEGNRLQAQLAALFAIFSKYSGKPSGNFTVSLQSGSIDAVMPG